MQAIPEFTDDVESAHELLARIESNAPKVAAAVRGWIVHATFGLPGAGYRLQLCDEALAVPPDAEDPWWTTLDTSVDMTGHLHVFRGHALLALGRRGEFETNVARTMELGETKGNSLIRVMAHARVALLAMLDGRFHDVPLSADRMLEAAPKGHHFRTVYFSLLRAVAFEEGRHADLLPMMDAALAIRPDLAANHASLGRICLANGDRVGAAEALDLLAHGWTGWARDWSWPAALVETAEIVAGLEATEHAQLVADELGPYAGELSFAWGSLCYGPFDRYRGMMLALLGRHDEAIAALTAAIALEELIESPPFAARTRYWLARTLLQRLGPGDRERAADELRRSIETTERLGMAGLARAARELAGVGTQTLT